MLVVEDGTGLDTADAYVSRDYVSAYWTAQPHLAAAATWSALGTAAQDGAIREATASIDRLYGERFKGVRLSNSQALLWPRSDAMDERGYPLPAVPMQLQRAPAELAARAAAGEVVKDQARGGAIQSVAAGVAVTYAADAPAGKTYTAVDLELRPLMKSGRWGFM